MANPNTQWTQERTDNVAFNFQVGDPFYITVDPFELCLDPFVIGQDTWTREP